MAVEKRKKGRQITAMKEGRKGKKRKNDENEGIEADQFFMDSEDERDKPNEEEEEVKESAEEKRLRLAKAYLKQLRAQGAFGDEELEGENVDLDDDEVSRQLKQQAQEAGGYLQRQLAERISIPSAEANLQGDTEATSRFLRCHREAVTSICLTEDESTIFSVGKEGSIIKTDVETGRRSFLLKPNKNTSEELPQIGPDWMKKGPRNSRSKSLLACAVTSDGSILAVGGGDRSVHIWDLKTQKLIQSFPGHKDIITGLAFRYGTHTLYSASFDRSIKLWSIDDRAYVDTLFGHQAEVLSIDALRQERVVSAGHDHTCRVWKIAEESQLIYRSHATAMDCCRYMTGTEWVTGSNDGTLSIWSQLKKKPAFSLKNAHPNRDSKCSATGTEAGWIQSVAVCRGSDFLASGAGDGFVRLWQVHKTGANRSLTQIGALPVRGFVTSLAIPHSGRFVVAAIGQEPRLGRWAHDKKVHAGLSIHKLHVADED